MTYIDVGTRFGNWTVIKAPYFKKYKERKYKTVLCQCDCGIKTEVLVGNLITGKSTQCQQCAGSKSLIMAREKQQQIAKEKQKYFISHDCCLLIIKTHNIYLDNDDYELVKKYTWYVDKKKYVVAKNDNLVRMHNLIMQQYFDLDNKEVDHIS